MTVDIDTRIAHSSPIPTGANKAVVSQFAEQLAAHLNFKPGDLIKALVSKVGGRIEYRNPEIGSRQTLPESIIVYSFSEFVIFVPHITSPERDRFTIAHELGHFYLHYPLAHQAEPSVPMIATRWVDENDKQQQRAEWEANWFAASFLMPEGAFKDVYRSYAGDLGGVAVHFGVSRKAAEVRASVLTLQ